MESLRTINQAASGGACRGMRTVAITAMALFAAIGCTNTEKNRTNLTTPALPSLSKLPTISETFKLSPSKSPTQVICLWQRRLASLPDPTRDGVVAPGIVGQAFLITADNQPADVQGDMIIMMTDETKYHGEQKKQMDQVYHFDPVTLKKLITNDERFGKSIALFLPWPSQWNAVNAIRIQVRYKQKGMPDLYAGEANIVLDHSTAGTPVWNDVSNGGGLEGTPRMPQRASRETRGVPDISNLLEPNKNTSIRNNPVQQTAVALPMPTQNVVQTQAVVPIVSGPAAPAPLSLPTQFNEPIMMPVTPMPQMQALPLPQMQPIPQPQAMPVAIHENPIAVPPSIPIAPPVISTGEIPPLPTNGMNTITIPRR